MFKDELPALRNGMTCVSRFRNIVHYLRQYSNGAWDLDAGLSGLDKADCIAYVSKWVSRQLLRGEEDGIEGRSANCSILSFPPSFRCNRFSSFVEAHGQPLIDLSLYVSSQNYWGQTSPAYGAMLQWPNQWILPTQLRSAAKVRTEHLGLSSLDLEATEEERSRDHAAALPAGRQIPASLVTRPRETVSSLLGKTAHQNQFKLHRLTAEFLGRAEELLGSKPYMLSSKKQPSSVDCLALAYLCLALVPDMPHAWLRESLKSKSPALVDYTQRLRRQCFGVVELADAGLGQRQQQQQADANATALPWRAPQRVSLSQLGSTLLATFADSIPVLKDIRATNRLRVAAAAAATADGSTATCEPEFSPVETAALSQYADSHKRDIYLTAAAATAGVAAFVLYVVQVGLFSPVAEEDYLHEHGDAKAPEDSEPIVGPAVSDFWSAL